DSKRVTLPRPLDGMRPLASIHSRKSGMFAGRVDPFSPPPGLRFVEAAPVMVAGQIVHVFTTVLSHHAKLPDDLFPFLILRRTFGARHVPEIERDVPGKA